MPFVFPIQWQVLACAALCALGATLGLITLLAEMRYHLVSPTRGPAYATAALCAGIVLGLWIPRRTIRRRLEHGPGGPGETLPTDLGGVKLEFAASLSGALIVTFALTWVVLCGGAVFMEDYRAFLARRFLQPVYVKSLLLWAPMYAGLMFAGAAGTTLLVALHGWYRLVTQPNTNMGRLWTTILLGALAAGLLAHQVKSPALVAWLAPLAVFIAGGMAVFRRSDAVGAPTPPRTHRTLTRDELLSLLAAGLAAAVTGTALFLATPPEWVTWHDLAWGITILAGAACAGLFAARALLRLRLGADWGPLVLLLAAVALLSPYQQILAVSVNTALIRLAVVTGCAAACIVLLGRRISQTSRSVQHALSRIGGFVAGGFGITLALLPPSATQWNPSTLAMIVALVATAGAGLMLILDSRPKAATRLAGLVGVGLWLFGVPPAARALSTTLQTAESDFQPAPAGPLVDAARQLLIAHPFRTARVQPLLMSTADPTTWQFDLAGPPLDLVIVEGAAGADAGLISDTDLGRRLLKRATTRLAQGGRLLVEWPTAPFIAAALDQLDPATSNPMWSGYQLRVRDKTGEYEARVFGRDIPALIGRHMALSELDVSLGPLNASSDARR